MSARAIAGRRELWHGLVAGAFVTASLAAWRIDQPDMWLVVAAGTLLFIAVPGAAIIHLARKQRAIA